MNETPTHSHVSDDKLSDISLGIVCPMANEGDTVESFVEQVLFNVKGFKSAVMYIVLDNATKDDTISLIKSIQELRNDIKLVWAPENCCVVDAYIRGYKEALAANCEWILEIDGGFSHSPSEIPQFFEKMREGYDCVFGSRFIPGGGITNSTIKRYLISKVGSSLANILLGTHLKDMTSGFELFTRESLSMVLEKGITSKAHFFQTEIKYFCRNLHIAEVPIHYSCPSSDIGGSIIADSIINLWRLFKMRMSKTA